MNKTKSGIFAGVLVLALMMVFAVFTGCVSDDSAKQVTALEDKGYTITANLEYTLYPDTTWIVEAEKQTGNVKDYVRVIYFSSEDSAIEHYETIVAEGKTALEKEAELTGDYSVVNDFSSNRVSNIIVLGTKQGVKDVIG